MFDSEGYENYVRGKMSLENALTETGYFRASAEVETQMQFVEYRLIARIKQAHSHAEQEMRALWMVLIESTKKDHERVPVVFVEVECKCGCGALKGNCFVDNPPIGENHEIG